MSVVVAGFFVLVVVFGVVFDDEGFVVVEDFVAGFVVVVLFLAVVVDLGLVVVLEVVEDFFVGVVVVVDFFFAVVVVLLVVFVVSFLSLVEVVFAINGETDAHSARVNRGSNFIAPLAHLNRSDFQHFI